MCPEIINLANIKPKCFHPTTYQCLCAYTAKQRSQQSTYTPKHKKAKAEETKAFFQARAATLKAYKQKRKEANQGALSSTNEEGYPGEGPKTTFASANIRGFVRDNKFYKSVKLMADDRIDV
eukprot:3952103-Pleurochrysis_carterae.AAC.1